MLLSSTPLSQTPKLIGPPGGSVEDIALHRYFPNIIYSFTDIGACFRSTDGGLTVNPITLVSGGNNYNFYPAPTDTTLIYSIMPNGGMLLKSNNSGMDFNIVYVNNDDSNNTYLQFNPFNSEEIYLIRKENELWKSYDGGITWNNLITFDTTFVTRVAIAPGDTSFIYVVAADRVYRSTDSGISWELRGHIPGFIGRIIQLEVNPKNKNSIYLQGGSFSKFYKSIDGGKTFSIQSEIFLYDFALNPNDSNIVYCASEYGIFKSVDEGQNWVALHNGLPAGTIGGRTIEINPLYPDEIFAGIGSRGVYKSTNAGNYWYQSNLSYSDVIKFEFISNEPGHLITTQYPWFVKMTNNDGENWFYPNFSPPYDNLYGFSTFEINPFNKDEGFLTDYVKTYQTSDAGLNWQQVTPFNNSLMIWYHKYKSNILFGGDGSNVWRTTDSGTNWEIISTDFGGGWFVYHPQNDSIIYAYSYIIAVQKSTDMGATWQDKTNGLIQPGTNNPASVSGLAIRKDNPNILYCVQDAKGGISKSIDGGENWFQIDSSFRTLNTTMSVSSIYLDEIKPGRFYVSTKGNGSFTNDSSWGGLFLTEDDGLTWRKLFTGHVTYIRGDNSNPKNIYFNTFLGIMKIPDTLTTDISREDDFIPQKFELLQNYPNPFNPSTTISWQSPFSSHQTLKVYDILGREVATLVNEWKEAGRYSIAFDGSKLASGVYIYQLRVNDFVSSKKLILLK
jgi:photosystem II stability/assembly factor-like uncharacterized protein